MWQVKQYIQKALAEQLGAFSDLLNLADGFPIPVCHFKRSHFSPLFKSEAAYGYCTSKGEKYYGFKGNLLINSEGTITGMTAAAANIDERESLWDLIGGIQGMVIADKGLIGADYRQELMKLSGINLQTAVRDNMEETRSPEWV